MNDRILGVLGGMGPLASAQFMVRLTLLTEAASDQDHIPAVLWSDPTIPDRAPALLGLAGADSPLPAIRRAVQGLRRAGCGAIAMPCNTVHGWSDEIEAEGLPVLHIVDAVAADLSRALRPGSAVGIIGTAYTLASRLYEDRLERAGWRCLTPARDETDLSIMPAISAVKGNRVGESFAPIAAAVRGLVARGAAAVVLGCTELPISIAAGPTGEAAFTEFGAPLIDSIDALARASITWARGADVAARAAA
jgi:aspartate racemase